MAQPGRDDRKAAIMSKWHPLEPEAIPTYVVGCMVLDAMQSTSPESNIVHVICRAGSEYVVWDAWRSEDGAWHGENGAYGRSRAWALGILVKRLRWEAVPS